MCNPSIDVYIITTSINERFDFPYKMKKDYLEFTQENTKLIKDVIDKIIIQINNSPFILFSPSYNEFIKEHNKQIKGVIDKITIMTDIEFTNKANYTSFFNDLRSILNNFFDYIKNNIIIDVSISDEEIINIVNNQILKSAKEYYNWINNKINQQKGEEKIEKFMEIKRNELLSHYAHLDFVADMMHYRKKK